VPEIQRAWLAVVTEPEKFWAGNRSTQICKRLLTMLGSGTNTDMEKSKAKFRYKKPAFLWLVTPQEIFKPANS
jgi:sigma54-dependent transcription regulator